MGSSSPDTRLDGTRGAILKSLRRGERTVLDLATELGLTPNGARLHVERLQAEGIVEARGQRRGVSKSSRLYGLTRQGRRVFSSAEETLLRELLDELGRRGTKTALRALLARLGRRMARAWAARGTRPAQRLEAVVEACRALGGDPVVERHSGRVAVRMHQCPLADLVATHPAVCAFGHALVTELMGVPVQARCVQGEHPSCHFEIVGRSRAADAG